MALFCTGCGGKSTTTSLTQHRMLASSDLPAGWKAVATKAGSTTLVDTPCLAGLASQSKSRANVHDLQSFVEGSLLPSLTEVLARERDADAKWQRAERALARCHTAKLRFDGHTVTAGIHPLPLHRVSGVRTAAYAWALSTGGVRIGVDLVLFTVGHYGGELIYVDLGSPSLRAVTAFVAAAVAKLRHGATAAVPDTVSVASTPVRTAKTADGKVGYRTLGAGPPLVLIMGYGGTMETWDRRFVDALAQRHRVVVFDNAGIGHTADLGTPLTIDAMADQTSALIDALGLRHPDVLGWSMGSMVAQALAVLHPAQVRRLILCAGYPGDGSAVKPSQQAIAALNSGDPKRVAAAIFPADQSAAASSYQIALSAYPAAPAAAAKIVTAQAAAIKRWWNGGDPVGRRTNTIGIPTLVADGTRDRLDAASNSHRLVRLIRRATLKLYPDAGHAFLFQDWTSTTRLVESFLSGGS